MARYGKSASGNPLTSYVNMFQTPEERRGKYAYLRSIGVKIAWARTVRDWRWTKINLYVGCLIAEGFCPDRCDLGNRGTI